MCSDLRFPPGVFPHPAPPVEAAGGSGKIRLARGASDRIGQLIDGRLLAVDVKGPKGKLQADQAEFLSLVRRFGGVAFNASACPYVY